MNDPRPTPPQPAHPQGQTRPTITPPPGATPKIPGIPAIKAADPNLEPLSLVDEPAAQGGAAAPSKIKAFGAPGAGGPATHAFKRTTTITGHGACRVRSFHGRLSPEGLTFMDEKINEWLDQHPDIEVKIVTTTIGQFEGKIREPALVVNIWY